MRGRRHGFSLIEVVVAVVIVGGVGMAAMATVAAQNDVAYRTRRSIEATTLAELRLAEIGTANHAKMALLPGQAMRGEFEPPFDDYEWRANVVRDPDEDGLFRAAVSVRWSDADSLTLATAYHRNAYARP